MMDTIKDIVEVVLIALVITLLIRSFVVETFVVDGPSMEPTLYDGERLLVLKLAYRLGQPKRGDVVVLRYPFDPRKDYIKRIVATGGETVELRLGRLYVNNKLIEEPYVHFPGLYNMSPTVVPEGMVFVLGDHRTNSEDSRFFGPVRQELLKGKAVVIIWPPKAMGLVK